MCRSFGHSPSGSSQSLSCLSFLCCKGPAKRRRSQRTICSRSALTEHCTSPTGSTGTSSKCRASTTQLLSLRVSSRQSCTRTSSTSTIQSQYPNNCCSPFATDANVDQGHPRQEVQPPCVGTPRDWADASSFNSKGHSWWSQASCTLTLEYWRLGKRSWFGLRRIVRTFGSCCMNYMNESSTARMPCDMLRMTRLKAAI